MCSLCSDTSVLKRNSAQDTASNDVDYEEKGEDFYLHPVFSKFKTSLFKQAGKCITCQWKGLLVVETHPQNHRIKMINNRKLNAGYTAESFSIYIHCHHLGKICLTTKTSDGCISGKRSQILCTCTKRQPETRGKFTLDDMWYASLRSANANKTTETIKTDATGPCRAEISTMPSVKYITNQQKE